MYTLGSRLAMQSEALRYIKMCYPIHAIMGRIIARRDCTTLSIYKVQALISIVVLADNDTRYIRYFIRLNMTFRH